MKNFYLNLLFFLNMFINEGFGSDFNQESSYSNQSNQALGNALSSRNLILFRDIIINHFHEIDLNKPISINNRDFAIIRLLKIGKSANTLLEKILDMGANPNITGEIQTDIPILIAVSSNNLQAVELLLKYGANVLRPYRAFSQAEDSLINFLLKIASNNKSITEVLKRKQV